MEKSEFIKAAPNYIVAAIVSFFDGNDESSFEIDEFAEYLESIGYPVNDDTDPLVRVAIVKKGLDIAVDNGFVKTNVDVFGPPIFVKIDDLERDISFDLTALDKVIENYKAAGGRKKLWLTKAFQKIMETERLLGVTEEDFREDEHDWEPIQLDRSDEKLNTTITKLEEAVNAIRADNGYAAKYPQERGYVVSQLQIGLKHLETEASTTITFTRTFIVDPLFKVVSRFRSAAVGLISNTAIAALRQWLTSKGITELDSLFDLFRK